MKLAIENTYASKSTAVRGAKRAGLDLDAVEVINQDGRWGVFFKEVEKVAKMCGVTILHRSQFAGPVAYVHAFMDTNPGISRKDAVKYLVENGVATHTAATQINRWKHKNGLLGS